MGSLTWLSRKNLFNNKCQKHYVFGKKKKTHFACGAFEEKFKKAGILPTDWCAREISQHKKKKGKTCDWCPTVGGGGFSHVIQEKKKAVEMIKHQTK